MSEERIIMLWIERGFVLADHVTKVYELETGKDGKPIEAHAKARPLPPKVVTKEPKLWKKLGKQIGRLVRIRTNGKTGKRRQEAVTSYQLWQQVQKLKNKDGDQWLQKLAEEDPLTAVQLLTIQNCVVEE